MRKIAIIGTEVPDSLSSKSKVEVFEWDDVSTDIINLRDYDGLIIDVSRLNGTVSSQAQAVISPAIVCDILSDKHSFIVVVGNPKTHLFNKSLAEVMGFDVNIVKGFGDSMRTPDKMKGHKYERYTSRLKQFRYSFELIFRPTGELKALLSNDTLPQLVMRSSPVLVTKTGYGIASGVDALAFKKDHYGRTLDSSLPFRGELTLLPMLDVIEEQFEIILSILDSGGDETAIPDWAEEISVIGQGEIDKAIVASETKLAEATAELETLAENRASLRQSVELLYKSDKPLEKSLKTYMSKLGFTVSEPKKETNKVEFYLEQGTLKFVVEVKSTTKQMFDQKGLRQANDWRDDVLLETGEIYKPLFIGSNQYSLKPSERSDDYLAQNLIDYAVSRDIACITVTQLFDELQKIEAKKMTVDELAQKLHDTKGLYVDNRAKGNTDIESKG